MGSDEGVRVEGAMEGESHPICVGVGEGSGVGSKVGNFVGSKVGYAVRINVGSKEGVAVDGVGVGR